MLALKDAVLPLQRFHSLLEGFHLDPRQLRLRVCTASAVGFGPFWGNARVRAAPFPFARVPVLRARGPRLLKRVHTQRRWFLALQFAVKRCRCADDLITITISCSLHGVRPRLL